MRRRRSRIELTPWADNAVAAAGFNRFELHAQIPEGWFVYGSGRTARGPFSFEVRNEAQGKFATFHANRVSDIPGAVEGLLVYVADESLLDKLTASVEALA